VPVPLSRAVRMLGPALDLAVDPARITVYATGKLPGVREASSRLDALPVRIPASVRSAALGLVARRHPFVLGADRYPRHWPIDEHPKYLRLTELLDHLDAPESTSWWRDAMERVEEDGSFRMKDGPIVDEAGLRRHFETYLLPLVAAFERDGYRADVDVSPGRVHVSADGTLHKTNKGTHRFVLARRFGGDQLRVRVTCVHADWWEASTSGGTSRARLASARDALRGVAEAHRG